jgi:hypothetical protein
METGRQFIDNELKGLWKDFNRECGKKPGISSLFRLRG